MIKRTARALYLAGLGAATSARQQGQALFTLFVTEGRRIERRERHHLSGRMNRLKRGTSDLVGTLGRRVESGCRAFLSRGGLPTRNDLNELATRLDELADRLNRLV